MCLASADTVGSIVNSRPRSWATFFGLVESWPSTYVIVTPVTKCSTSPTLTRAGGPFKQVIIGDDITCMVWSCSLQARNSLVADSPEMNLHGVGALAVATSSLANP